MIRILKKTYHSSTFDLNETSGQVEESTLTPLSPSAAFNLEPIEGDASYDKDSENPIVFYIDEYGYLVTESNVRAVAAKLQYSGTFMEIPSLSVTVKSPALIQWEIGDYIVWDYDGQTYTLRNIPQVKKQARTNTYGEAFVYENMQFVSVLSELKNLDFLDVVLSSTPSHFTTLPIFSFFGNCYALIDRINANLGRLYANWEVKAANVVSGDIYDALYTEREVKIDSPIKVWDAIALFYSMWGLGFVYSYNESTNKHNLTVGATGGETGNFEYGQGSGLRMITTSIAKEDNIVTRLRAYGSTRNMPSRYYNNKVILIDRLLFTDPLVYLPNLMIPYWKWDVTNGDPKDAYIDCDNDDVDIADTSFAKYGVREASIFFDGTGDLEEIYPTIERITAKEVRDAIAALQYESAEYPLYHSPSAVIYPDTERLDLVKVGDTLDDSGIVITTDIYKETVSFAGGTANYPTTTEQFTIQLDPMYSQTLTKDGDYKATLGSQTIGLSGVDTDILSARLKMWLTLNGNKSILLKTIDGEISMGATTFTLPDFTFSAQEQGDTYAIEISIDITTTAIIEEGIANVNCAISSGSLTYELVKSTPIRNFSITLKQIGFDIKRFLPNAGQSPVISMTSGACQGREFIVKETTYNPVTDDWTLLCARQADTSIGNQWFPNVNFHIAQGDSFVILNTSMPEFLINVAEERLYIAACNWLRKNKEPKFVYEPQIDNVYMAYNSQLIKEGMMMPLSDTDLSISGSKLINSVTITENEGAIRTFSVVLRDEADKDLLKYINEAAKNESNSAVGGITNAKTSKTESAEQPSGSTATSSSTPSEHNNLEGLQGGQASQYWHLTQAQASYLEKLRPYLKITEEDTALYGNLSISNIAGYINLNPSGNIGIGYTDRSEKFAVKGSGYFDTTVQMAENINTRLRIPSGMPSGLTSGFWYLYSSEGGFTGEVPSGGGATAFSALTDVSLNGTPTAGQVPMWGDYSGIKLRNTTLTKSHISDFPTTWAWANLTGVPTTFTPSEHTHDDRYYTETEIGNFFSGASAITGYNKSNWDNAYSWGNHAGLYPLYNGTGATGTWGINISGNSATTSQTNFASLSVNSQAVIHSGNIGSQSVNYSASAGNADTLDNQHASYFATASQLNAANLSNGYLPYWNSGSLVNSPITTNGTDLTLGSGKVTITENINTRLRIPKLASGASPSGMTSGQWYIYIQE